MLRPQSAGNAYTGQLARRTHTHTHTHILAHLQLFKNAPLLQEMVDLPDYNKITFKENPAIPLEEIVPDSSPQAVDLLYKFLVYPSKQRCSAQQVREEEL